MKNHQSLSAIMFYEILETVGGGEKTYFLYHSLTLQSGLDRTEYQSDPPDQRLTMSIVMIS